jgi:hypothetical protein
MSAAPTLVDELPRELRALVLRLATSVGSDATKNKAYLATQLGGVAGLYDPILRALGA